MKKYKNRKDAVKMVVAVLCAACMLTACGNAEADAMEEIAASVTETTTESAEVLPTEKPAAEPTEAPAKTVDEGSATEPVEPVAVTAEPDTKPSAEPVAASAGAAAEAGYTCTEMTQTMYAKSAVNVRDLPSTDGKKIGSLKASQEIIVTGKCDQTGWYRFDLNGTTGYVSDKYIVSEKPAVNTVASANNSSNTAGNTTAATQQNTAAPAATPAQTTTTTVSGTEEYFDRAMAEQVFALVNNDRVANGLNALAWNEDLYNIAVQRCYENDVHAGMRAGTSENYASGPTDANRFYEGWHDSTGHYNNYMNASWTDSAVAIRVVPLLGGALGYDTIAYQVFQSNGSTQSVTINTPVQDDSVAAAPKTADGNTGASSSNVGWSLTPPTQEDGLKKWQEQNPDAEVSFGN